MEKQKPGDEILHMAHPILREYVAEGEECRAFITDGNEAAYYYPAADLVCTLNPDWTPRMVVRGCYLPDIKACKSDFVKRIIKEREGLLSGHHNN